MSATPQQMCIMVLDALFTLRPGPRVAQKMRSPYGQLRRSGAKVRRFFADRGAAGAAFQLVRKSDEIF